MKILVLGVLLAVVQATPPVPRHTADKPNSSPQYIKNDASNDKAPAAAPSPSPEVAASSPEKNAANNPIPPNAKQPITVSEFPSVSVTKDWMDRSAWGFGLVLLIVGIAGVCAAVNTLKAIKKQAGHMEEQNDKLGKSIALAEGTAERQLRAYVCIASGLVKFLRPGVPEAQIDFANYGQTPAYDVQSWIHMWIENHPLRVVLPEPPEGFEMSTAVLPPGGQPHSLAIEKKPPVQEDARSLLCTAQGTIYIYGMIRYRDAFGKQRTTRYRLICGGSQGGKSETASDGTVTARLQPDIEGNEAT